MIPYPIRDDFHFTIKKCIRYSFLEAQYSGSQSILWIKLVLHQDKYVVLAVWKTCSYTNNVAKFSGYPFAYNITEILHICNENKKLETIQLQAPTI